MPSQQSTNDAAITRVTKRPVPMSKPPRPAVQGKGKNTQKNKSSSKAAMKGVNVNVSSSSGVTVNVKLGSANSQFKAPGRDTKRERKLPTRLLD